jgi:trehalose 6-phosphate synthase
LARLILVSNRVASPIARAARRAGGLEVALTPTFKRNGGVWFGWSGNVVPRGEVATQTIERSGLSYVLADLSEEDYEEYYNGFANRVLWPILHYRIDLAEFTRRDLTGYLRVNAHFASELSKILHPDDLVWIHDYHFIPLGEELRQRGHTNRIGFFLHVPFPAPEVTTVLPHHERLLSLLLQYDQVGFQTESDVRNFVRYVISEDRGSSRQVFQATDRQFVLSHKNRQVRIGSFPVGIDTNAFERLARRAARSSFVRDVVESLGDRALVIGVDRLDYSKGLVQRMEAFERFFSHRPDWRNKVTYLQITPQSRSEIQEYNELEQAVSAAAGRINAKYGEVAWTPIRYVNRAHSRSALAGLYRSSQAALVTPLRDGMNLVAKEYIAAQNPEDPGVLILSRFAGAADECADALLVNPYDSESVASALERALEMPLPERIDRHKYILAALSKNDGVTWAARFLQSLEQLEEVGGNQEFWGTKFAGS